MSEVDDEASFTFSWRALKLLGRGLYSNPWSALSELVANGLDAGASDVYVYVDARDKAHAIVEVIDNGSGMSRSDIETYVKVGHDKRKAGEPSDESDPHPKGRKGIGKLAALYLSPHFYLSTRHTEGASSWELDAREGKVEDDEHPSLLGATDIPTTPNDHLWEELPTGTRLTMLGVDLTGYGRQAINALGTRLANQFLLPINSTPRILIWVQTSDAEVQPAYEVVEKSIAFRNFSEVVMAFPDPALRPTELEGTPQELTIPAKLPGGRYTHTAIWSRMSLQPEQDEAWDEVAKDADKEAHTYLDVPYALTGWIGVHATIDNRAAQENDERFTKNRYYNPAQIRVYVRGKLASDRLLSQLGLTGTYANYIEGEITFDLLDADTLPDIATSNRQDFDETDKRVTLLRTLVRPLARQLIQGRNQLASEITAKATEDKERRESASKRHFADQLRGDLDQHDIPQHTRDELQMVITNKIQGDVKPKQSYKVFISHARADGTFASFIDELLRERGAKPDEVFFTSRTGSTEISTDERALSEVVKRNITDDNTLIFYMTSKNFLASQFCLFEGGAGWATRAVSEYLKLNVDFESIPGWLTNGRGETLLLDSNNSITLRPDVHNYLVDGVLNPMIDHLNRGREIAGEALMERFERADIPLAVEMARNGATPEDYFDTTIAEHWELLVEVEVPSYLEKYLEPSEEARNLRLLEEENMRLRASLELQRNSPEP